MALIGDIIQNTDQHQENDYEILVILGQQHTRLNRNEYYTDKMTHRFTGEDIFYKNLSEEK